MAAIHIMDCGNSRFGTIDRQSQLNAAPLWGKTLIDPHLAAGLLRELLGNLDLQRLTRLDLLVFIEALRIHVYKLRCLIKNPTHLHFKSRAHFPSVPLSHFS